MDQTAFPDPATPSHPIAPTQSHIISLDNNKSTLHVPISRLVLSIFDQQRGIEWEMEVSAKDDRSLWKKFCDYCRGHSVVKIELAGQPVYAKTNEIAGLLNTTKRGVQERVAQLQTNNQIKILSRPGLAEIALLPKKMEEAIPLCKSDVVEIQFKDGRTYSAQRDTVEKVIGQQAILEESGELLGKLIELKTEGFISFLDERLNDLEKKVEEHYFPQAKQKELVNKIKKLKAEYSHEKENVFTFDLTKKIYSLETDIREECIKNAARPDRRELNNALKKIGETKRLELKKQLLKWMRENHLSEAKTAALINSIPASNICMNSFEDLADCLIKERHKGLFALITRQIKDESSQLKCLKTLISLTKSEKVNKEETTRLLEPYKFENFDIEEIIKGLEKEQKNILTDLVDKSFAEFPSSHQWSKPWCSNYKNGISEYVSEYHWSFEEVENFLKTFQNPELAEKITTLSSLKIALEGYQSEKWPLYIEIIKALKSAKDESYLECASTLLKWIDEEKPSEELRKETLSKIANIEKLTPKSIKALAFIRKHQPLFESISERLKNSTDSVKNRLARKLLKSVGGGKISEIDLENLRQIINLRDPNSLTEWNVQTILEIEYPSLKSLQSLIEVIDIVDLATIKFNAPVMYNQLRSSFELDYGAFFTPISYHRKQLFGFSTGHRRAIKYFENQDVSFEFLQKQLETSFSSANMVHLLRVLNDILKNSEEKESSYTQEIEKIYNDIKRSLDLAFLSDESGENSYDRTQIQSFTTMIRKRAANLNIGERLYLPCGCKRHATLLVLEMQEDKTILPIFYNTGFGSDFHTQKGTAVKSHYPRLAEQEFSDSTHTLSSSHEKREKRSIMSTYQSIDLNKKGELFEEMMEKIINVQTKSTTEGIHNALEEVCGQGMYGKRRNIQLTGNCSFEMFQAAFKDALAPSDRTTPNLAYVQLQIDLLSRMVNTFKEIRETHPPQRDTDETSVPLDTDPEIILDRLLIEDTLDTINGLKRKQEKFQQISVLIKAFPQYKTIFAKTLPNISKERQVEFVQKLVPFLEARESSQNEEMTATLDESKEEYTKRLLAKLDNPATKNREEIKSKTIEETKPIDDPKIITEKLNVLVKNHEFKTKRSFKNTFKLAFSHLPKIPSLFH